MIVNLMCHHYHHQEPGPGRGWRELASEDGPASSQAFQDGALYQAVHEYVCI